jgi:hypothetical protein
VNQKREDETKQQQKKMFVTNIANKNVHQQKHGEEFKFFQIGFCSWC